MNDTTEETFPPADPKAEFERQCRELNERRDFVALPGIRFAMHPDDLCAPDDVSNERYFNERFIEPRMEGEAAFLARLAVGCGIVMPLFCVFILAPLFGEYRGIDERGMERSITDMFWFLLACTPLFLGALFFVWFASRAAGTRVRFNRQAQLVHVFNGKNSVQVPWPAVHPFMELGSDYRLRLFFPVPYTQLLALKYTRNDFKVFWSSKPYMVSGEFDSSDSATFGGALERLEFIRRYMEHGIGAIQPLAQAVTEGWARKPSGFVADNRSRLRKAFSLSHWAYMLALGPWVDRWIQRKADAYQWPEEVERLCAPDADLSGYDTTPVKSRTDVYYVYRGMDQGIIFVDANGKPVHGLRR